ncbi:MAG: recombinase family protein, partial [Thermoplasmata archaeon]
MTQPVALYARVSTGRQEQEKTIDSQIAALRSLAEAQGFAVSDEQVYRDEGYSGARLDRPGLDSLRDAAGDGRIGTLLVYDPDRLARNFVHQQVLLEELERRSVKVVFAQRPLTDRPEDRLLAQMQGVFAEYERTKILERTRRGRLYKARLGLFLGWTIAPYGYRLLPGPKGSASQVVVEEAEARWVRQMFQWIVEEGLSVRKVARRLNQLGVAPRKAPFWSCSTVRTMLVNPAYTGTAYYNRSEAVEPKRRRNTGQYPRQPKSFHRRRPQEEWVAIPVPALVSREMQVRTLAELRKHRWTFGRFPRHPYLLRRLVTCGECGLRMNAAAQLPRSGLHP